MAGFDGTALPKLDWRFTTGANGTVPEPSTEQVGAFFDQLHIILDRPDGEKTGDTVKFLEALSNDQMMLADEKLIAAYAALCSDQPTAAQISVVPHRERQMFFGWITDQVVNPT